MNNIFLFCYFPPLQSGRFMHYKINGNQTEDGIGVGGEKPTEFYLWAVALKLKLKG
jgi:hypothetical protein